MVVFVPFGDGWDQRACGRRVLVPSGGGAGGDCCCCIVITATGLFLVGLFLENGHPSFRHVIFTRGDSFGLGRYRVIIFLDQVVHVTYFLEQNVKSLVPLNLPEYLPVLEPSVRKYTVYPSENIRQLPNTLLRSPSCLCS